MPANGRLRLAIVGRREAVGWCAPGSEAGGIDAVWLEPGEQDAAAGADVLVCLEPSRVPDPGALSTPAVAWLGLEDDAPESLAGFARVIVTGEPPPGVRPWRSAPPPVADRLFSPVRPWGGTPPRIVAPGVPTPYRELVLRHLDLSAETAPAPPAADVVCVVGAEPGGAGFPPWLPACLAAGALVVAEPLSPAYGLEPGIDLLVGASAAELQALVHLVRDTPDAALRVRRRGRAKAEGLRASRAWPRLARDLVADLRTFG